MSTKRKMKFKRDPDLLRATKLRKIAKNLGVVSARLGRTRSETRKQSNLSKIQTIARSRYRQGLLKRVSLAKTESQNLSQVFGEQKDYVFDFKPFWSDGFQEYVYQSVCEFSQSLDTFTLIEQLRRLFLKHKFRSGEGHLFKVVVFGSDYEPGKNERPVFSTKYFQRFGDLLRAVIYCSVLGNSLPFIDIFLFISTKHSESAVEMCPH